MEQGGTVIRSCRRSTRHGPVFASAPKPVWLPEQYLVVGARALDDGEAEAVRRLLEQGGS